MTNLLPYLLMPVMAGLLVTAQALWGSVIKRKGALEGSLGHIFHTLITSPRMWLGAFIYILATLTYFYMLSRLRFFSVQIAMTGLSIIFSSLLAVGFFHEKISLVNITGAGLVILGVALVIQK